MIQNGRQGYTIYHSYTASAGFCCKGLNKSCKLHAKKVILFSWFLLNSLASCHSTLTLNTWDIRYDKSMGTRKLSVTITVNWATIYTHLVNSVCDIVLLCHIYVEGNGLFFQTLFVGVGADEQLAGYSRHRTKFRSG